jgi:predicted N-acetyltransferase YhbS
MGAQTGISYFALSSRSVEIFNPQQRADFDAMREIFRENATSLNVDLSFQNFEEELAALPGQYAAPRGASLVAKVDGHLAACCALRPLDNAGFANACEMRRLYVRPAYRGLGLGRQLAETIMEVARLNAYHHVLLDTLDDMEAGTHAL